MDIKKIVTTTLLPVIGTATIVGSVLLIDKDTKQCRVKLDNVTEANLVPKLVDELNKYKVAKDENVEIGCKIDEVYARTDLFNKKPLQRMTDEGCVKKTALEFEKIRTDTVKNILELDKLDPVTAYKIKKDFTDLWNYVLFRNCGVK
jgi:hypothetical protein